MTITEQRREKVQQLRSRGIAIPHDIAGHLDQAIPGPEIRKWSWWAHVWPRPTAANWQFNEAELAAAQTAWDTDKRFVDAQNAIVAELDARKAAAAEQARQEAERQAAATREQLLIEPKRAYLASGGAESGWDKIKDDIADEIARQHAIDAAVPRSTKPVLPREMYR